MKKLSILFISLFLIMGTADILAQGLLKKLEKGLDKASQTLDKSASTTNTTVPESTQKQEASTQNPETEQAQSSAPAAIAENNVSLAQNVLKIHFTDASKKIVIPKEGSVSPEIHEGMIALHKYPQQMFVNAQTGEYVFGTDFFFHLWK